jgi:hypothetical protein
MDPPHVATCPVGGVAAVCWSDERLVGASVPLETDALFLAPKRRCLRAR